MDASTVETDATPHRHRLRRTVGWIFASLSTLFSFTLWGVYRFLGDTTPLGEAFTTIPPIVWLAPLSIFILPAFLVRPWRARSLVVIGMLLLFLEDDVRSLLYWSQSWHRKTGIRVVTWNIAGQSDWSAILGSMESLKPDIVFLQETPDGDSSITTGTLSGYWEGFHWWDQSDCGILCRYPMNSLPSGKVGPWDKPALALADVSRIEGLSTKTIVLCSVRLMMPVNAIYPGVVPSVKDHETRTAQYTALATLLMEQQQKHGADAIIGGVSTYEETAIPSGLSGTPD